MYLIPLINAMDSLLFPFSMVLSNSSLNRFATFSSLNSESNPIRCAKLSNTSLLLDIIASGSLMSFCLESESVFMDEKLKSNISLIILSGVTSNLLLLLLNNVITNLQNKKSTAFYVTFNSFRIKIRKHLKKEKYFKKRKKNPKKTLI